MQLVSETSEREVARSRAGAELVWPLEQLAANLLRVVRGAGSPERLASQMVAVLTKFERYHDAVGCYPSGGEISEALSIRYKVEPTDTPRDDFNYGIATVVQGALQVAASELLDQRAQRSAGETELLDGLKRLERYWEGERQRAASKGSFIKSRRARKAGRSE